MGIEFTLTKEQPQGKPKVTVLHLGGWLDAQNEPRLVEAVQQAMADGAQYMVFDLSALDTTTSAGIRAMQKAYQLLTPKDEMRTSSHLRLCNASPRIYEVLSVTGLLVSVPMYESVDIAVDSFGQ